MQVLLLTTHSDRIAEDGTVPPSALGVNQSVPSLPGRPAAGTPHRRERTGSGLLSVYHVIRPDASCVRITQSPTSSSPLAV